MYLDSFTTKKTLRWYEPFGGWNKLNIKHDHFTVNIANPDTGFCNRIMHWEIAEYLNTKNNNVFKIWLEANEWPELKLIHLPNTFTDHRLGNLEDAVYNTKYEKLRFKTVIDPDSQSVYFADRLDMNALKAVVKSDKQALVENHYYSDFGYTTLHSMLHDNEGLFCEYNDNIFQRPLTKIELRHTYIKDLISEGTYDTIGIHMRRFNGVTATNDDLKTFRDKKMEKVYKEISKNKLVKENYTFWSDDKYFEIIEKILKINPNQKFYISHDLPDVFLEAYIQRFGDRIIDRRFFTLPVNAYLQSCGFNLEEFRRNGNAINNIIDLFALSYCPILIPNRDSTWSEFAQYYNNSSGDKPVMPIDWSVEHIVENYKNNTVIKIPEKHNLV
jgi:hypothetical protein